MSVINVVLALAIVCPIGCLVGWLGYLMHASDQGEFVKPTLPKLIPWSTHGKVRRRKAELALMQVETDLYEARHNRLQKELIYTDLENERYRRALETGGGHE